MNEECWITAHVNTFKYFGGVTRIIQCDNLKTGVTAHRKSEIILNKTYSEMAEHYRTAILPCRVRSPKDKAMVEGTVGIITNFILATLRNRRFLSLHELNTAIHERLSVFNHKPFQKREGSRASEFEEENTFLLPLPERPFELSEWRVATVGPNYHISVDRQNYSVPNEYIKQKVDIRITNLLLRFSTVVTVSVLIRACTAEPISTAPWNPICPPTISSMFNGTVIASADGLTRLARTLTP